MVVFFLGGGGWGFGQIKLTSRGIEGRGAPWDSHIPLPDLHLVKQLIYFSWCKRSPKSCFEVDINIFFPQWWNKGKLMRILISNAGLSIVSLSSQLFLCQALRVMRVPFMRSVGGGGSYTCRNICSILYKAIKHYSNISLFDM